jgi:hypothetical protein
VRTGTRWQSTCGKSLYTRLCPADVLVGTAVCAGFAPFFGANLGSARRQRAARGRPGAFWAQGIIRALHAHAGGGGGHPGRRQRGLELAAEAGALQDHWVRARGRCVGRSGTWTPRGSTPCPRAVVLRAVVWGAPGAGAARSGGRARPAGRRSRTRHTIACTATTPAARST